MYWMTSGHLLTSDITMKLVTAKILYMQEKIKNNKYSLQDLSCKKPSLALSRQSSFIILALLSCLLTLQKERKMQMTKGIRYYIC